MRLIESSLTVAQFMQRDWNQTVWQDGVARVNRLIKQLTDQATIFGVIGIFETPDHKIRWWSIEKGYNGFADGAVAVQTVAASQDRFLSGVL